MNFLFMAFISINNYLNDIAVLMLLASGIYLWVKLTKRIREIKGQAKTA